MSFAPRIIMCLTCQKPVERIEQFSFWEGTLRHMFRIRVHCHGQSEQADVTIADMASGAIEFTGAFPPPRGLLTW